MKQDRFRDGAVAAACIADDYNASTSHGHRLGDCILSKLNLRDGKPRKNTKRLENAEDAWARGVGFVLVEVYLNTGATGPLIGIARSCGLTLKRARAVGLGSLDLRMLKRIGVR